MIRGASHTEFIRAVSGDWYFLETSARVGGAFIVEVVEAATGVNLWREWAKVEIAGQDGDYDPPAIRDNCGGIVLSLARQEQPDLLAYDDAEIAVRIRKSHHARLIVTSPDADRVEALIDDTRGASIWDSTPARRRRPAPWTDAGHNRDRVRLRTRRARHSGAPFRLCPVVAWVRREWIYESSCVCLHRRVCSSLGRRAAAQTPAAAKPATDIIMSTSPKRRPARPRHWQRNRASLTPLPPCRTISSCSGTRRVTMGLCCNPASRSEGDDPITPAPAAGAPANSA